MDPLGIGKAVSDFLGKTQAVLEVGAGVALLVVAGLLIVSQTDAGRAAGRTARRGAGIAARAAIL